MAERLVTGTLLQVEGLYRLSFTKKYIEEREEVGPQEITATSLNALYDDIDSAITRLFVDGGSASSGATTGDVFLPGAAPAARRATTAERHAVEFVTNPAGAAVLVDGVLLDRQTRFSRAIAEGTHEIVFQLQRYETARQIIQVEGPMTVTQDLVPLFGWLTIQTVPSGIPVTVDGEQAGITPVTRREVGPGVRTVQIEHRSWIDDSMQVTVVQAEEKLVKLEGRPVISDLTVDVRDDDGNDLARPVFVDDDAVGTSPCTVAAQVGRHNVRVGDQQQWVELMPGAPTSIEFVEKRKGATAAGGASSSRTRPSDDLVVQTYKPSKQDKQRRGVGVVMLAGGAFGTVFGFALQDTCYKQGRDLANEIEDTTYRYSEADDYESDLSRYSRFQAGRKFGLGLGFVSAGITFAGLIVATAPDPNAPPAVWYRWHEGRQKLGGIMCLPSGIATLIAVAWIVGREGEDSEWAAVMAAIAGPTLITGFIMFCAPVPDPIQLSSSRRTWSPAIAVLPGPVTTIVGRF